MKIQNYKMKIRNYKVKIWNYKKIMNDLMYISHLKYINLISKFDIFIFQRREIRMFHGILRCYSFSMIVQ